MKVFLSRLSKCSPIPTLWENDIALELLNQNVSLIGNSYSWLEEEWQEVAEPEQFYNDVDQLKTLILNDSFD